MEGKADKRRDLWTTILFTLLLLAGMAVVCLGVFLAATKGQYEVLALGVVAVMIPAAVLPLMQQLADGEASGGGSAKQVELLEQISDRMRMSALSRRVADRQRDREQLRQAILEDIQKEDHEAALSLVEQMARDFGYVEEAEQYRQQIIDARHRQQEQRIEQAINDVRNICARHDWDTAQREVDRLRRLYGSDHRIKALPYQIEQARQEHKRDLERTFLRAAEQGDTVNAMALLKELDRYLTPQEAAAYLETARGVIGQARENIAVRFRMAVSDKDWIEAGSVGEQIIREFPNSKMADEVRGMMDVLRERAAGQRAAETGRTVG